eukprot:TRINITY_DN9858_c0_g1_i2.p1 TRINITY_DN9858_c0_g1~~TRINITY_DN9858_c0_g1_i2.p1  ORF type:complete len:553 (+),score=167.68 TRINITY_DN9858_c0_g1_i2:54-1712(+)
MASPRPFRGAPRRPFAPAPQRAVPRGASGGYAPAKPKHPFLDSMGISNKFSFGTTCRPVFDISRRFGRALPFDLVSSTAFYAGQSASDLKIPLDVNIDFNLKSTATVVKTEAAETVPHDSTRHFVRVAILSGSKNEEDKSKTKLHLSKRLMFLLAKKEAGGVVLPIGGEWSKDKDGATPSDANLQKAAIRHAKEMLGLDLSKCTKWIKFVEFTYKRNETERSRTVVFVPNVWEHYADGLEPSTLVREESKEVTEEVEEEVEDEEDSTKKKTIKKKVTVNKTVNVTELRPYEMSLHSLREYDCRPNVEESMEMCLFADSFDEMLQRDFGLQIIDILKKKKQEAADAKETEKKRKREEEEAIEAKKHKTEGEQMEEEKRLAELKKQEAEKPKTKTQLSINHEMLVPFQYFDKQPPSGSVLGHLKRETLEGMLHQQGEYTKFQVDDLLSAVNLSKTAYSRTSPLLYYIKLATTSTEVPVEEEKVEEKAAEKDDAKEEKKEETTAMDEDKKESTEALTEESLNKLLLKDLRTMCTEKNLATTGKKQELIDRLLKGE